MNVRIEGRHLKVTPALQEHVHKKVDHLDKYFDGVQDLHVILSLKEPKHHAAEIVAEVVRGQPLVAQASHEDMYLAIDEAVHKIREHLKKFKERMRTRKRNSGRLAQQPPAPVVSEEVDDEEEA